MSDSSDDEPPQELDPGYSEPTTADLRITAPRQRSSTSDRLTSDDVASMVASEMRPRRYQDTRVLQDDSYDSIPLSSAGQPDSQIASNVNVHTPAGQSPIIVTTPNSQRRLGNGSGTQSLAGSTPINVEGIRVAQQRDEDDIGVDSKNRTPGGEAGHRNEPISAEFRYRTRLSPHHDIHSRVTMKVLKEITGLVNGVAETVDAIKDELSQSKEKHKEKSKPPLGVKVSLGTGNLCSYSHYIYFSFIFSRRSEKHIIFF